MLSSNHIFFHIFSICFAVPKPSSSQDLSPRTKSSVRVAGLVVSASRNSESPSSNSSPGREPVPEVIFGGGIGETKKSQRGRLVEVGSSFCFFVVGGVAWRNPSPTCCNFPKSQTITWDLYLYIVSYINPVNNGINCLNLNHGTNCCLSIRWWSLDFHQYLRLPQAAQQMGKTLKEIAQLLTDSPRLACSRSSPLPTRDEEEEAEVTRSLGENDKCLVDVYCCMLLLQLLDDTYFWWIIWVFWICYWVSMWH